MRDVDGAVYQEKRGSIADSCLSDQTFGGISLGCSAAFLPIRKRSTTSTLRIPNAIVLAGSYTRIHSFPTLSSAQLIPFDDTGI